MLVYIERFAAPVHEVSHLYASQLAKLSLMHKVGPACLTDVVEHDSRSFVAISMRVERCALIDLKRAHRGLQVAPAYA